MTADLALICRACAEPIEGDTGCLRVTFAALAERRQQEQEYAERHPEGSAFSITDFLLGPKPVHWLAYHDKCEPEPDLDAYQIDAVQLRTWRGFAKWTAHLMAKNWFAATDWNSLLLEAAGETA